MGKVLAFHQHSLNTQRLLPRLLLQIIPGATHRFSGAQGLSAIVAYASSLQVASAIRGVHLNISTCPVVMRPGNLDILSFSYHCSFSNSSEDFIPSTTIM